MTHFMGFLGAKKKSSGSQVMTAEDFEKVQKGWQKQAEKWDKLEKKYEAKAAVKAEKDQKRFEKDQAKFEKTEEKQQFKDAMTAWKQQKPQKGKTSFTPPGGLLFDIGSAPVFPPAAPAPVIPPPPISPPATLPPVQMAELAPGSSKNPLKGGFRPRPVRPEGWTPAAPAAEPFPAGVPAGVPPGVSSSSPYDRSPELADAKFSHKGDRLSGLGLSIGPLSIGPLPIVPLTLKERGINPFIYNPSTGIWEAPVHLEDEKLITPSPVPWYSEPEQLNNVLKILALGCVGALAVFVLKERVRG